MIGMVTVVLTGSAAGLLATIAASHSAVAGFVTGGVVGAAVLVALMWFRRTDYPDLSNQRLGRNTADARAERRVGTRLLRALRTVGNPDHGGAESGEVVSLCIAGARRELPLLPHAE
jgi:hypothetical protein